MGRFWAAVLGIGLCVSFVLGEVPTHGWELLDLNASFLWKYEWYNQRGHQGFFGPHNIDNGPGTTTNLNFWNGAQFDISSIVTERGLRLKKSCLYPPLREL